MEVAGLVGVVVAWAETIVGVELVIGSRITISWSRSTVASERP